MGFKKRKKFSAPGFIPNSEDTVDRIIGPSVLGQNPAQDLVYEDSCLAEAHGEYEDDEGSTRRVRATVTIEIEEI